MAGNNPNPGAKEEQAERRVKAFELSKAGASYRQIGAQLGVSVATVHKDVTTVLKKLNDQTLELASLMRAMQTERLDTMLLGVWPQAKRGDVAAVDRVLRIEERRSRLWGLDMPIKQEITGKDGGAIKIMPMDYRELILPLATDGLDE